MAIVPLSFPALTSAGSARVPSPKNARTEVSTSATGPCRAAAKMLSGSLSVSGAPVCATLSVRAPGFQRGASIAMFRWKPVVW